MRHKFLRNDSSTLSWATRSLSRRTAPIWLRIFGLLIGLGLPFADAWSQAVPNVLGTYTGDGSLTQSGCQDPSWNGTYSPIDFSLTIGPQNGSSFTGSGVATAFISGFSIREDVTITTGTVTTAGALSGSYNFTFFVNGSFDSSGTGTFAGTLVGNTISINTQWQDTAGDTCTGTESFTATRPPPPPPPVFPDLVVTAVGISNSALTPGQRLNINASVTNQGNGASGNTTLRYFRSVDSIISASDAELGTDQIPVLTPGSTSPQSLSSQAPTVPGTYYIGACVDPVNTESNTLNNCSSAVEMTVANPASAVITIINAILLDD